MSEVARRFSHGTAAARAALIGSDSRAMGGNAAFMRVATRGDPAGAKRSAMRPPATKFVTAKACLPIRPGVTSPQRKTRAGAALQ
jgi:hypothetical protein